VQLVEELNVVWLKLIAVSEKFNARRRDGSLNQNTVQMTNKFGKHVQIVALINARVQEEWSAQKILMLHLFVAQIKLELVLKILLVAMSVLLIK
jgi:hypothetical protein